MGSIILDLPFSLMLGLKFMSNLTHKPLVPNQFEEIELNN